MRTLFKVLGVGGLVLVVLSVQVLRSPDNPLVLTEVLDDWYGKQMIWCLIIGLVVGAIGASVARGRIRHRPHDPAVRFLEGVAGMGLWTMAVATGLAVLVAMFMAATADFEPMAPPEKVRLVASSGKALGLLGATLAGCALAFALSTRVTPWGGQYAILGPGRTRIRSGR